MYDTKYHKEFSFPFSARVTAELPPEVSVERYCRVTPYVSIVSVEGYCRVTSCSVSLWLLPSYLV